MKRKQIFGIFLLIVIVAVAFFLVRTFSLFLPAHNNDVDLFMESRMDAVQVPGMAAGIVTPQGVAWEGYYGTLDGNRPVSEDTLFMIASISKTVIATAAMQLWEADAFELDDDINDYLDFEVHNPHHPQTPITFRQLMTHRSSISDGVHYDDLYTIDEGGGDFPVVLGEYIEAYLVPGGEYYDESNYNEHNPGETFDYSNNGAALLAYLVEVISGQEFTDYCREHIFLPLGMEHTYHLIADIPADETEVALSFENGEALPIYNYPDYPAGSIRTTIRDLSRFAAFYLDPAGSEVALLQLQTVELMFGEYGESTDTGESQMGLIWVHMDWMFYEAIGHTGGDPGVSTNLLLYPDEGFATILFMNGCPSDIILYRQINDRLRKEGQRIVKGISPAAQSESLEKEF